MTIAVEDVSIDIWDVRVSKPLEWIASSFKDVQSLPPEVRRRVGFALRFAQEGDAADYAKPMKGALGDVMEICVDDDRGEATYRAAYTVKIGEVIYVLDAFNKKATKGIATPKHILDRIEQRLKMAREHHAQEERQSHHRSGR